MFRYYAFVTLGVTLNLVRSFELHAGTAAELKTGDTTENDISCTLGGHNTGKSIQCGISAEGGGDLGQWEKITSGVNFEFTQKGDTLTLPPGESYINVGTSLEMSATKTVDLILPGQSTLEVGDLFEVNAPAEIKFEIKDKSSVDIGTTLHNSEDEKVSNFTFQVWKNAEVSVGSGMKFHADEILFDNEGLFDIGTSLELHAGSQPSEYVFGKSSNTQIGTLLSLTGSDISLTNDGALTSGTFLDVIPSNLVNAVVTKSGTVTVGTGMKMQSNEVSFKNEGHLKSGIDLLMCAESKLTYEISGESMIGMYSVFENKDSEPLEIFVRENAKMTVGTKLEPNDKFIPGQNDMNITSGKSILIENQGSNSSINVQGSLNIKAPEVNLKSLGSICVQETLLIDADKLEMTFHDRATIVVGKLDIKGDKKDLDTSRISIKENPKCESNKRELHVQELKGLEKCFEKRNLFRIGRSAVVSFGGPKLQSSIFSILFVVLFSLL